MTSPYIAPPTSRKNIREYVSEIRKIVGFENEPYFPIVEYLELGLPIIDQDFVLEIESVENMPREYGLTFPENKVIVLREDVYERAINGVARDRFTVAHELGHYLMHGSQSLKLAREVEKQKIPAYKNPEWQANTFAGELLAPPHIIKNLSLAEISNYCGVSYNVAEIQSRNL